MVIAQPRRAAYSRRARSCMGRVTEHLQEKSDFLVN
jgi:hypothetical protein